MTPAKHTPGPWTIHDNIGRKGTIGVIADAAPCIIATMGNAKEWPVEAQANAHLIAAAPELLQALERAETFLDSLNPEECTGTDRCNCGRCCNLRLSRDAIAKAKGVQS